MILPPPHHRRHFCPHKPRPDIMNKSDVPCNLTEYTVKFKKYENHQPRTMICPPRKLLAHDGKISSDTTTREHFVAHPVTPPVKKLPATYKQPEKEMDKTTEYNTKFLGKWQSPTKPILPRRTQKDHTECFNHSTTTAADFLAPPVTPRQVYKAQNAYESPKTPFDNLSTAHTDFVDYGTVPLTPSLKPVQKTISSTQPLDGLTSYRKTFTTPLMPEKFQKPIKVYAPSKEKLSSSTTSRCAFPKHPITKPPKIKRAQADWDHSSHTPIESCTTNRLHYKAWELPERFSRPPTAFIPPTEKVSDRTTFKVDYPDYGHVPLIESFKPAQKSNEQVVPLECLTTHNADYKTWENVKRREPISRDKHYEPPEEKFNGITTFKAHYKGEFVPRPPSAKPTERLNTLSREMDTVTMYKENFSGSGYKPCPVIPILANAATSEFTYSHEDAYGHKLYNPVGGSETVKA